MIKVALITCYKKQDYVRASTLAQAITDSPNYQLVVVKNRLRGIGRYLEVILKLLAARLRERPDVYVLTFRGYEMLLPARLLTLGKPLVFDEFINAEEWLIENKKVRNGSFILRLFHHTYHWCLQLPRLILADTPSHAAYSAQLSKVNPDKYVTVPIGTDETLFVPTPVPSDTKAFEVFYYSTENQPLHGMKYVCKAAETLAQTHPDIHFTLIGGGDMARLVTAAQKNGAHITHHTHVPYTDIAKYTAAAHLCLGGPFGNTLQSQYVMTGKTYQYMASGRPALIGANAETTRQVFKDKVNCLVAEQGSAQALVEGIAWAYQNRSKLAIIGTRARATYEQHFSQQQVTIAVRDMLERCS